MILLLQCIKSARWPTDHPLSLFPGVQPDLNTSTSNHDSNKQQQQHPRIPSSLTDIPSLCRQALQGLMSQLSIPATDRSQFLRAVSYLPHLHLSVPEPSAVQINVSITRLNHGNVASSSSTRQSSSSSSAEVRVWTPRFPKPQTESFFVVVANEQDDEIVALKRVGWHSSSSAGNAISHAAGRDGNRGTDPNSKPNINDNNENDNHSSEHGRGRGRGRNSRGDRRGGNHRPERAGGEFGNNNHLSTKTTLKLPPSSHPRRLEVLVISDAYPGMQWRVPDGVEVPAAPTFQGGDDGGKEKGKG